MKMNQKLGAAVALALLAAPAFAAPTEGNTLYIAGATAVDRTLFESLLDQTNGVCDGALPINVYTKVAGTGTSPALIPASYGNWTVHCTVRTGLALAGTEIGVAKSSSGSEFGIDPVADGLSTFAGSSITFANVAGACATAVSVPANVANSRLAYTLNQTCGSTAATAPQVGVSDVEPALFGASTSVKSRLTNNGALVTPFTMTVSLNLYRALQTAQGITGACATDTASTQSDACTPNVTIAQVRSLMSQNVYALSQISGAAGAAFDTTYAAVDPTILVCRRGDTSGSQKSFERLFFGQNCGGRSPVLAVASDATAVAGSTNCKTTGCTWTSPATPAALATGTLAPNYVFQGSGSGDVEKCLDYAAANNIFAVGILSADRVPSDAATTRFRYVKIEGVLPSVENVIAQKWSYNTENVFTNPTGTSPNLTAYNTGNRSTIFSSLVLTQLRNPVNVAKTHSTSASVGFGRIGLTVRPSSNFAPLASDTASTRPVSPSIRALTHDNAPVNNCAEMAVASEDVIKF
jgi:hypothetical protein